MAELLAEAESEEVVADDKIDGVDEAQETPDDGPIIELDDEEGSHPNDERPDWVKKRLNKLGKQKADLKDNLDAKDRELERERQEKELLKQALAESQGKPTVQGRPNPDDYEDGEFGDAYKQAYEAYIDDRAEKKAADIVNRSTAKASESQKKQTGIDNLNRRFESHYEKAEKLGAKDYEDTEDKAREMLGDEATNQIVSNSERSAEILYYLGKNPSVAEKLVATINSNPVRGVMELGRIEAKLKVKPRSTLTPDPDEELEGGSPVNETQLDKKIAAALAKARKGGDISEYSALAKQKRELGRT